MKFSATIMMRSYLFSISEKFLGEGMKILYFSEFGDSKTKSSEIKIPSVAAKQSLENVYLKVFQKEYYVDVVECKFIKQNFKNFAKKIAKI